MRDRTEKERERYTDKYLGQNIELKRQKEAERKREIDRQIPGLEYQEVVQAQREVRCQTGAYAGKMRDRKKKMRERTKKERERQTDRQIPELEYREVVHAQREVRCQTGA